MVFYLPRDGVIKVLPRVLLWTILVSTGYGILSIARVLLWTVMDSTVHRWCYDPKYCPSVTVDCSGLYCPKGGVIFLIIARVLLWTVVDSTVQGGSYIPNYCPSVTVDYSGLYCPRGVLRS